VIPELREFPGLGKRQRLAARLARALAPGIDIPLRPEEQDVRSGSYEVVVPALERQRKVDDLIYGAVMAVDVAAANPERVRQFEAFLKSARVDSADWPVRKKPAEKRARKGAAS